jgi:hypothetical protein
MVKNIIRVLGCQYVSPSQMIGRSYIWIPNVVPHRIVLTWPDQTMLNFAEQTGSGAAVMIGNTIMLENYNHAR